MVRLQRACWREALTYRQPSPSHYGSTATGKEVKFRWERSGLSIPLWFDCNTWKICRCFSRSTLSIPLWFDCNKKKEVEEWLSNLLSIPLWFDCNPECRKVRTLLVFLSIPLWFDCNVKGVVQKVRLEETLHPTMVRLQHWLEASLVKVDATLHPTMVRLQPRQLL